MPINPYLTSNPNDNPKAFGPNLIVNPRNDRAAYGTYDLKNPTGPADSVDSPTTSSTTPNVPSTIPLPDTNTKAIVTRPTNPPSSSAGLGSFVENLTSDSKKVDEKTTESQATADTSSANYLKELMGSADIQGSVDYSRADAAKKISDRYSAQILADAKATRDRIESVKSSFHGSPAGLADEIGRIQNESSNHQADLAILKFVSDNDYQGASEIASRQLAQKTEQSRIRLDALKFIYQENRDAFNKADDRAFQAKLKAEDRQYKKTEAVETTISTMKLNAAQYAGKDADRIINALSAIDTSQPDALAQAAKIGGKYLNDPIDRAMKSAQLAKLQRETSLLGEPTTKEKQEEADKLKQVEGQRLILQDKIDLVDTLIDNPGMATRVGPNITSRAPTSFLGGLGKASTIVGIPGLTNDAVIESTGAGQAFAGRVHQLTSKEFVNALIDAKAQGATFGNLTDREGDALRASATAINDWEIKDKNGLGTGVWNIDEATFKQELRNIQKIAQRSIYQAQGGALNEEENAALNEVYDLSNMPVDPATYY